MVKVKVQQIGNDGSFIVTIPLEHAETLGITKGTELDARVDLDTRNLVYRKIEENEE